MAVVLLMETNVLLVVVDLLVLVLVVIVDVLPLVLSDVLFALVLVVTTVVVNVVGLKEFVVESHPLHVLSHLTRIKSHNFNNKID